MERKCEECKWAVVFPGFLDCKNGRTHSWAAEEKRATELCCGPSGRYWEPREEEE